MKDSQAQGRTALTGLDAAAASMARGASGVWLRAGSRLGLACRGTVYLLVGYLAFRLALAAHGREGEPASSAGAVQAAVDPAWGRVPLVLLVAGLAAYALTQLLEAVFRPARAAGTMGRWRQRAVSSWGFVLYSVFCLSTARLLVETPPQQTAQSEQRQDTGMTAGLAANGMGQGAPPAGRDPCRSGRPGGGPPGGSAQLRERFTDEHMSRALAMVTRALGAFGSVARAVVSARPNLLLRLARPMNPLKARAILAPADRKRPLMMAPDKAIATLGKDRDSEIPPRQPAPSPDSQNVPSGQSQRASFRQLAAEQNGSGAPEADHPRLVQPRSVTGLAAACSSNSRTAAGLACRF